MGHLRLGRLPLRHNWQRVVEVLESSTGTPESVAAVTAAAANRALGTAADSGEVHYPFWLLVQLSSRSPEESTFEAFCRDLDVDYSPAMSALELAEQFIDHVRSSHLDEAGREGFAEAAVESFQQCLLGLIANQQQSLFEAEANGLRESLAQRAGPAGFGRTSREFLGGFLSSILRMAVSYGIADSIGPGRANESLQDAEQFRARLDTYARDVSQLVEEFGAGWYSKNLWQSGDISQDMASGFLHVALRKFRQQLEREAQ